MPSLKLVAVVVIFLSSSLGASTHHTPYGLNAVGGGDGFSPLGVSTHDGPYGLHVVGGGLPRRPIALVFSRMRDVSPCAVVIIRAPTMTFSPSPTRSHSCGEFITKPCAVVMVASLLWEPRHTTPPMG